MNWTSTREHSTPCADSATGNGNPFTPKEQPHREFSDLNLSITESVNGATKPTKEGEINNHRYDQSSREWFCLDCKTICASDNACDCCVTAHRLALDLDDD